MANQMNIEELNGCKTYYSWLKEMASGEKFPGIYGPGSGTEAISEELCRVLYETDFVCDLVKEDEIRAADAVLLRREYAEEVGGISGKNEREIDRIWKSILGKCSLLEMILGLCIHLDAMVNEGEEDAMVSKFYRILVHNIGLDGLDDEDFDHRKEAVEAFWKGRIDRFMGRKYESDGSDGGLFPLKKPEKDQKKVSIWYQMNAWLEENLDEDGAFLE